MIPKKIHYCWLSGEPYPEKVRECIDSWHRYMPDWEYVLWDAERVRIIDSVWLKECLQERQWAFAADFIRIYALSHEGGIYLDTDCEALRSMEPLLSHEAFIGRENYIHIDCYATWRYLSSHCMGGMAGHSYLSRCLHYYDDRHFVRSNDASLPPSLRFDRTLLPLIQCLLAKDFGYDPSALNDELMHCDDGLVICPYAYFDPIANEGKYCKHWTLGNWMPEEEKNLGTPNKITVKYWIKYNFYWRTLVWWRKHGFVLTWLK